MEISVRETPRPGRQARGGAEDDDVNCWRRRRRRRRDASDSETDGSSFGRYVSLDPSVSASDAAASRCPIVVFDSRSISTRRLWFLSFSPTRGDPREVADSFFFPPVPVFRFVARNLKDGEPVPEDVAAAFASEFELEPRDIVAVLEHYRARAAAGETGVSPAPSLVKPKAVVEDDDDAVTFTVEEGISDEVRAQVCCGELKATLVLPKGYKRLQEYVIYPDGTQVTPASMERDAGKGAAKNWKFTVRMVEPDGSVGKPFKTWMEQMGYYPKGTIPDAPPKKRGSLKEQRKKAAEEKKAKAEAKKAAAAKRAKPKSAPAAKKEEKAPEKPPEKSIFETQLENLLDEDGGVKVVEKIPNLVWMMKNVTNNGEKSLVITVIHRTRAPGALRKFAQGEGLKLLKEWFERAKADFKSSLILKMLLTLERIPISVAVLKETAWGKAVSKLSKYAPPPREGGDADKDAALARRVVESAEKIKNRWQAAVLQEQAKAEEAAAAARAAAAAKEKAAAAAAAEKKKRDAPAAEAAAAAKRAKIEPAKPVSLGARPAVGKVNLSRPSTTTTTVVSRPTAAKPGLSFGGINIRGAGFPAKGEPAKPTAPAPPPTPMLFKKKKSKRAAAGVSWPDSHDSLEMVKIFDRREAPARCNPDPEVAARLCSEHASSSSAPAPEPAEEPEAPDSPDKDDDEDEDDAAAVAKARERQERELAAEARAAQLTRQRRLNEMKAVGRWRSPSRVPYARGVEISKGPESTEAPRLRDIARRTREAMYADAAAPDSPAEPPRVEMHDDAATPVIPLHPRVTPAQQQQQQQHQHQQGGWGGGGGGGGGAPPALNQAALNSLLSSMQSNPSLMANIGAAAQNGGGGRNVAPLPPPHRGGGLRVGDRMVHPAAPGGLCAFFNTPLGCRHGNQCKFRHELGAGVQPPLPPGPPPGRR